MGTAGMAAGTAGRRTREIEAMSPHATPATHASHEGHAAHAAHAAQAPEAPPAGAIYTCPMHPEIRRDHPGNCPKCGMTLEPVLPALGDDEENPELRDFQRRFWWTLPFTPR